MTAGTDTAVGAGAAAERARLAEVADQTWEGVLTLNPMLGTYFGDERHDHELPRLGEAGRAIEEELLSRAKAGIDAIDPAALDPEGLDTYDLMVALHRRASVKHESGIDRFEVANHLEGPGAILGLLASIQQADTPERLDRYAARLDAFPRYLDEAIETAREGARTGVLAPAVIVQRTLDSLERLLALPAHDSPALAPAGEAAGGRPRLVAVVAERVMPALARFRDVLRAEILPAAPTEVGLSAIPGGDRMYAGEVEGWTSLPLDPATVHEAGRERFEAIQQERFRMAAQLGYASPAEAVADRKAQGRNSVASAEALLKMTIDQVERSWQAAPAFFGRLPRTNCTVRLVEEFRQADQPAAFYNPPTEDGTRPGVYFVNPYELDQIAAHRLAGVTFHEANPGHHFQVALEQEMPGRSDLRKYGGWLVGVAFAEGWGLYSERLADEMDLYLDDWERLGMLENQALRAARLVTDTGLHTLGWTREAAIALLEEGGQTHPDAVIEVDRYIALPGQALSYMIGMAEIEAARAKALAGGMTLRDFHDAILAHGALPLGAFRRVFGLI